MNDEQHHKLEIDYREFRDGDETAIVSFFNFVFGRNMAIADWEWAYRENPARRIDIVLAFCGSTLVGVLAAIPLHFQVQGRYIDVARMQDGMVHPDYRGRGIFIGLVDALTDVLRRKHLDLVVQFPNNNSFPVFMNKLEYCNPGDIFTFSLPAGHLTARETTCITAEIEDPGLLDQSDADFMGRCLNRYQIYNNRNLEYLHWRYNSRSGKQYFVLRVREAERQVALIIFKLYTAASSVDLVEFFADPEVGNIHDLLNIIKLFYNERGISVTGFNIWSFPHYADHERLLQAGFEKTEFLTHIITKSFLPETVANAGCATAFYLSMGDSDVY
jgi:GNAT superfamily N-acetyltransferase